MDPGLLEAIKNMPESEKAKELAYMAKTIPSSWEFVDYVFAIEGVSRAFTHQFVRTRHGSYAQQSLRIVDAGEFEFIMPNAFVKNQYTTGIINNVVKTISDAYKLLVGNGYAPEDVRAILPTNISTNITAKFNLRTLVDLAKSRTGGRTQGEYQAVVNLMIDKVLEVHPWAEVFFFGDRGRDYFAEIEEFANREYGGDLIKKGELLKIVDAMRKGQ
jgi:flavin-dependent thymidylate synthase